MKKIRLRGHTCKSLFLKQIQNIKTHKFMYESRDKVNVYKNYRAMNCRPKR